MRFCLTLITLFFVACSISSTNEDQANNNSNTKGKLLFEQNCQSCHLPTKALTAPPFQRIRQYKGQNWVYKIVKNNAAFYGKDERIIELTQKYKTGMTGFPNLSNADIDAICDYVDSFPFDPQSPEYIDRK